MKRQDISTHCIDNHETIIAMNEKEWATPTLFINGKPVGNVQTIDFAGDDSEDPVFSPLLSMSGEFTMMKQSVFEFSGAIVDVNLDLLKMFLGLHSSRHRRIRRRRTMPIKRGSSNRRKQRLTRLQRRRKRQTRIKSKR